MRGHAARRALAARARGDDEIASAVTDRLDQGWNGGRIVGAVAVHEDDERRGLGGFGSSEAGAAVATAGADDLRASAARALRRRVAAAAIDDDHASRHGGANFA